MKQLTLTRTFSYLSSCWTHLIPVTGLNNDYWLRAEKNNGGSISNGYWSHIKVVYFPHTVLVSSSSEWMCDDVWFQIIILNGLPAALDMYLMLPFFGSRSCEELRMIFTNSYTHWTKGHFAKCAEALILQLQQKHKMSLTSKKWRTTLTGF